MIKYILVAAYIISTISGLLLVKIGGDIKFTFINNVLGLNISLKSVSGILLYSLSFVLYMWILQKFNLSYIVPFCTGIVYILVIIISYVILHESISIIQLVGITLVLSGIVVMQMA